MPQAVGETTISDESRGGLEGRRHVATKDKGGSKSGKKAPPRKDPQTEAPDQEGEQAGGTAKVVRRLQVDDAARAVCAAPREQDMSGLWRSESSGYPGFT